MMVERPTRAVHEQSEFARARDAEKTRHAIDISKAARIVAKQAVDAQDYTRLLSMLGLESVEENTDDTQRPQM